MVLITLLFLCGCCLAACAYAGAEKVFDPQEAFQKANILYRSQKYEEAVSEIERILKQGLASGNLYYNLGNCYVQKGELGRAILNYERARLFIPRDSALLANHRYAMSLMKQRDIKPKKSLTLQQFSADLSPGETIAIFFVVYYTFALFFILSIFAKRYSILLKIITALLCCIALLAVLPLATKIREVEASAIVVSQIADAKLEPLEDATTNFPLYEGMKVNLLKERRFWQKVKRPDGKVGWVKLGTVERILP